MKQLGILLIAIGAMILLFTFFRLINQSPESLSPIHEDDGVKVIYETPTK